MAIYKIGRAEGNTIVLPDKSISRNHAELEELGAGRFRLKDLGSSAGTTVLVGSEWTAVTETEIRHDTRIRLGEYETSPMELLRDQDMTAVQAKTSAGQKAPAPAAPRPAAPRVSPPVAPRRTPGPGLAGNPKMMWWLLGGGGAVFLLIAIVIVVVLLTGSPGQQASRTDTPPATPRTDTPPAQPPPRTETPPATPPAQPPAQPPGTPPAQPPGRTQPPPAGAGAQKFTQSCRTAWQRNETICRCWTTAAGTALQEADYDDMIAIVTLILNQKGDEVRQKMGTLPADKAQRIRQAAQAIDNSCKNVQ